MITKELSDEDFSEPERAKTVEKKKPLKKRKGSKS